MGVWIPDFVLIIPGIGASIFLLILSGLFEKYFISRGAIIANIVLLWQVMLPIKPIGESMTFYLNLSLIFFLLALYSNLSRVIPQIDYQGLHSLYYGLAYGLYSSKTVLGFAIASLFSFGFGGGLVIAIILWFLAIKYLDHNPPFIANE